MAEAVCDCAPDCAERIKCTRTDIGHRMCGWCDAHQGARHLCGCPHDEKSAR